MKNALKYLISIAGLTLVFFNFSAQAGENWKGHTETPPYEFGALSGMSIFGSNSNWSILGSAAYLINPKGWVDDVDNRVWVELELGPSFFSSNSISQTGVQYSAHLRWDFTMNEYWTFYGLGGVGGYVLPSYLGGGLALHPRFGAGVEYQTKTALMFRGEVSAEFIGLGAALNF